MDWKRNEKYIKAAIKILALLLIIVISQLTLADKVSEMKYVTTSADSLEASRDRVVALSGATLTASTAISMLPQDWANPMANSLADMNKYFIFIFATIFLEKLILVEGIQIAFHYIIPAACILYMIFVVSQKDKVKEWATKILILGISIVCVVPFGTHFTEMISTNYMEYIDTTITEANAGAEKIYEVNDNNEGEDAFLDKVEAVFTSAFQEVKDLFTYFNQLLHRCINSVAMMIITTFVLPLFILLFFKWLLNELFSLQLHLPMPKIKNTYTVKSIGGKLVGFDEKEDNKEES